MNLHLKLTELNKNRFFFFKFTNVMFGLLSIGQMIKINKKYMHA